MWTLLIIFLFSISILLSIKLRLKNYKINLKELISKVLITRKEDGDRKIYSAYKNTSYYITLAKKLGLIDDRYYPSERAKELACRRCSYFHLDSFQKDLIFRIWNILL